MGGATYRVSAGAGRARGRDEGPVQETGEVMGSRRVGSYTVLDVVVPHIAARVVPGQFVSVAVSGPETLLRRPFSVSGVGGGPAGGSIEVVFETLGPGTAWLAGRDRHDPVDVVGPLGRGFTAPPEPAPCLLVGGGYGTAPLVLLGRTLRERGLRVDFLLGAATQSRLLGVMDAKRIAGTTTVTTEDGSEGRAGLLTDAMHDVLDRTGSGAVYACGPMPMLAAVSAVAGERGVPVQVAVEESMACGVGVCWTCVVPYRDDDAVANVRACLEGPVLDGARVDWPTLRSWWARGAESAELTP
ncbi:MAG: dihydroorotate dehydrogenase electron transfer subunit [Actinomycetota bacterium]|nr:dihydroorotate dehydrogenase electron transfer subunit [Actinomycetota bacterium]